MKKSQFLFRPGAIILLCFLAFIGLNLLMGCQSQKAPQEEAPVPEVLPFNEVAMTDLSGFNPVAKNWSVAGKVISDHTVEHDLQAFQGTGVVVNQNSEDARDNLFTTWEHGDIELDVEIMMPKGSNSGIYFQGRYEIQLFDSWKINNPQHSDMGGIYQRWDESKPEGQQGYQGHGPRQNAAKAAGLWQRFHILFRAPRFDAQGHKIENAQFEKVVLNGVVIHEHVVLTGPTRGAAFPDEGPLGPIMIQGDHGPVALRNFKYKTYFDDALSLEQLQYQYFEAAGPISTLPIFDSLKVVKQGTTDSLVIEKLPGRDDQVAYIFTGTLKVPQTGDYLFQLQSDDGSQLFIDGNMLIDDDGQHSMEARRGVINLTQGDHDLKITFFNNTWRSAMRVLYEGPEMRLQPLVSRVPDPDKNNGNPLLVTPDAAPEMVRSFVMHQGKKVTHAISVGDPAGIHYTADLSTGALLEFWRGDFADVSEMWRQRGEPQLLQPLEMSVEIADGPIAAVLDDAAADYPQRLPQHLKFRGYDINDADQPVFRFEVDGATIMDHYQPSKDSTELIRTIRSENSGENLYCRLAVEEYIEDVGNGYFSIGSNYYIRLKSPGIQPLIRESQGKIEMLLPLTASENEIQYSILW